MSNLSAEDALRLLKSEIEKGIRSTEEAILSAANNRNYTVASTLNNEVWGRKHVIYMIDEMLNEICGNK